MKEIRITDEHRARRLRGLLNCVREQWDACQWLLEQTPRLLLDHPPERLEKLVGEIGECDNCKDSLIGDVLGKLREIDARLVEGLSLVGVKVDSLKERTAREVAKSKAAIQRRIERGEATA